MILKLLNRIFASTRFYPADHQNSHFNNFSEFSEKNKPRFQDIHIFFSICIISRKNRTVLRMFFRIHTTLDLLGI